MYTHTCITCTHIHVDNVRYCQILLSIGPMNVPLGQSPQDIYKKNVNSDKLESLTCWGTKCVNKSEPKP